MKKIFLEYFYFVEVYKGVNGICGYSNLELIFYIWKINIGNLKRGKLYEMKLVWVISYL